jgi:hypothetical protein
MAGTVAGGVGPPSWSTLQANHGIVVSVVLGKWRYAPDLDVFIGLSNVIAGEVWVYNLHGWHRSSAKATL